MRKAIKTLAVTTLALTLALPFTAYAGTWQQDSTGWKVRQDDETYLTNQWYQNTDGKWYFLGADGYMMVNTITPDGYQVDANGVWNPSVTGTKHVTNGQVDTPSTGNANNSNNSNNGSYKSSWEGNSDGETNGLGMDIDMSKYDPADMGGSTGYMGAHWSAN